MTNKLMLAAMLALMSAAPAMAQETPNTFDSRWTPYLGCWTVLQDRRFTSAPNPAGTMVCVRPSGRFGVAVTTSVEGKNVLEQTIVADGSPQPISQGDCSGTQTSDWSRDGERLFTRVELTCANRPKRSVSGITMLANGHWVDAQATIIDGNSDVRLRRYRRSSDKSTAPAGTTAAPMSIEDIIEASAKVQSEALEAALDEANARFTVNTRVLKQLADNGVAPNVIDLLVAQAYPEKFEVQRGVSSWGTSSSSSSSSYSSAGIGSSSLYMGSAMYAYPMYDPFYSSYYYYSPFAYPYYWGPAYSYRYGSPFYRNYYNYNYYGFSGPGYYYGGVPAPSGSSGGTAQPGSADSRGGDGVVVNGRGYTRVRPAGSSNTSSGESATPSSRSPGSTRGVRSAGDSGSSSSSPSSSSSSSSGSSGASSGGYSSGGGGGDSGGGRTAQPR